MKAEAEQLSLSLESDPVQLMTDHLDLWSSARKTQSTSGRGRRKKLNLYGIKKLRELILELAVRGKLVPQDPNDEPASLLLEKIAIEKARLVKEKKIKKQKVLPGIGEEEKIFALPDGWAWCRLDSICHGITSGSTPPKDKFHEKCGIPYLKVYNIRNQKIDFGYKSQFVDLDCHSKKLKRSRLFPGDVVMNIVGPPLGKIALIPDDFPEWNCNQAIVFFRSIFSGLNKYIYTYLKASIFLNSIELIGTAGQDNISVTKSRSILLPTPPLAEQNRIVAKVDELMSLCDQLEQQSENQIEAHATLVKTLLDTLTNSPNANELQQNWQRLADHFDTLFSTEESIEQLKQTVLQLAVMGKLVPQDPEDEPASVLLEKIAVEKAALVKAGKIKKQKVLPEISEEEKVFALPDGWAWCRLDSICHGITSGSTPPKDKFHDKRGIPYLKVYNIRNQKIDFGYKSQFVDLAYHSEKLKRSKLFPGDVVMNIVGPPLGKIALIPDDFPEWNCNQAIVFFRPIECDLNKYIYTYLTASTFLNSIELIGTAGQDNISVTKSRSIVLPTPPLEEQKRIVEKVDKLMTLCDQLKERLHAAQETQLKLADALVEQAVGLGA